MIVPELAVALLPPGGKVLLAAVADAESEHLEAVKSLRMAGVPFSETVMSYERDQKSPILSVFGRRKETITKPFLMAAIEDPTVLHRMFEVYKSWLYFRDFFILGLMAESPRWKEMLGRIATASRTEVPLEMLDENIFLMTTAQEHGAYVMTTKHSRADIEEIAQRVCSKYNVQLSTRERIGKTTGRRVTASTSGSRRPVLL